MTLATGKSIPFCVYKGQPVISQMNIARAHDVDKSTISRAVTRHLKELIPGKDFFELNSLEIRQYLIDSGIYHKGMKGGMRTTRLFTKTGYAILACTFTGDKAAIVRRALVDNYFGTADADIKPSETHAVATVEPTAPVSNVKPIAPATIEASNNALIMKACEIMQETIKNQASMMERMTAAVERICSVMENREKNLEKNLLAAASVTHALDRWKIRDGEATLATLAERCNWYSPSGKPHIKFVAHVLRSLGVHTHTSHEYEDELSRCVIMNTDEEGECISFHYYVKPAGIQLLVDWCEETDYARKLKQVERYQNSYGCHHAGDIKTTYYLLKTSAIPGVCKAATQKYMLRDF